jgi:peptide deformylase
MSFLEVLKFPDPRLRRKAKAVAKVTPELQKLADDMLETMYEEKGIGLAAIQVGVEVRLLVIDLTPQGDKDRYDLEEGMSDLEKQVKMPIVIFNPVINKKEGKTSYDEGCLSVPGFYESVERSKYIEVTGLDRQGKAIEFKIDGLLSICMQHEIDHLDGKVFIDRLSPIKSNRIKAKIKKFGYPSKEEVEAENGTEKELLKV